MNEQVTVVIPAYNEGPRIGAVLKPLIRARKKGIISQILVVDDGSTDNTAKEATKFDVSLIKLGQNQGKGAAMAAGIKAAKTEIVLFLDADLVGLKESHIQKLLIPIVNNRKVGMTVGIFRKSGFLAEFGNMLTILSGQRAIRRSWSLDIPSLETSRYGADYLVTAHARKNKIKMIKIYLDHMSHVYKEQKSNFWVGFFVLRARMYSEIARAWLSSVKWKGSYVSSDADEAHEN